MTAKPIFELLTQDSREKIIQQSFSLLEEQGVDVNWSRHQLNQPPVLSKSMTETEKKPWTSGNRIHTLDLALPAPISLTHILGNGGKL